MPNKTRKQLFKFPHGRRLPPPTLLPLPLRPLPHLPRIPNAHRALPGAHHSRMYACGIPHGPTLPTRTIPMPRWRRPGRWWLGGRGRIPVGGRNVSSKAWRRRGLCRLSLTGVLRLRWIGRFRRRVATRVMSGVSFPPCTILAPFATAARSLPSSSGTPCRLSTKRFGRLSLRAMSQAPTTSSASAGRMRLIHGNAR